jgi:hypothetical protein
VDSFLAMKDCVDIVVVWKGSGSHEVELYLCMISLLFNCGFDNMSR